MLLGTKRFPLLRRHRCQRGRSTCDKTPFFPISLLHPIFSISFHSPLPYFSLPQPFYTSSNPSDQRLPLQFPSFSSSPRIQSSTTLFPVLYRLSHFLSISNLPPVILTSPLLPTHPNPLPFTLTSTTPIFHLPFPSFFILLPRRCPLSMPFTSPSCPPGPHPYTAITNRSISTPRRCKVAASLFRETSSQ